MNDNSDKTPNENKGNKVGKSNNYGSRVQEEIARLQAEKKAVIEEFEKVASEELTPEKIREKIREEILPAAWVSLQHLIVNAESESTRAGLIKWAFEFGSKVLPGDVPVDNPDAELTRLLKGIVKTT